MSDSTQSRHWWKRAAGEEDEVCTDVISYVEWLEEASAALYWLDRIHAAMYENRLMTATGGFAQALTLLRHSGFTTTNLRVASSIVDTVVAKIGKNRPAVKVNPSNADWSLKRKGRQLQKFVRGKGEELDVQIVGPEVLRDACVVGTGIAKVGIEFDEMTLDRVPREELFVDPREARYGKPRQIHQKKQIAREVLAEMFPEKKSQIADAPEADVEPDDWDVEGWTQSDLVNVIESWHLPSGPNGEDGRHAMAIPNATLLFEEWERPRFPFAFLRYATRRTGFWGRGLMEDLAEIQYQINETVRDIQMALYWGAQLKILVPRGSDPNKSALGRNQRPVAVEYTGAKPTWEAPNPVSKDQVAFLEKLIQWAYDLTGVSQMSAQAKNPLGAGASAVALQEFYDIESERLSQQEQAFATWRVDLAEIQIETAREIHAGNKGYSAKYGKRGLVEQIPWRDVDMKRDQYNLTLEASNFLPDTRAGKLEVAERMSQAGFIPPETAMSLFDFPDTESVMRDQNAAREQLEFVMEQLEDESVDLAEIAPDPYMNLAMGVSMAKARLSSAYSEGAPEEIRERFRSWIHMAKSIVEQAKAEEAAMQMPPPSGPEGMPMDPAAGGMPAGPGAPPMPEMPGEMPPPMPGVPPQ